MLKPDTTESVLLGATNADTADQTGHTAWMLSVPSDLIVCGRAGNGKSHAMRALLVDALIEGGDRG